MKRTKIRICPKCGSSDVREEKILGSSAFNIWTDEVCNNCGEEWGKGSKVDRISLGLEKGGEE